MRISDWSSDVCSSDLGKVWRTSLGWGMALMFGMTSLAVYSMFTWLPKILTEAGATPAFGGTMLALYSALGLAGALSIPALAVRVANAVPLRSEERRVGKECVITCISMGSPYH